MRIHFVVVPPHGGEADFGFDLELPAVPREGDWVQVVDPLIRSAANRHDFIVGRIRWDLRANGLGGESDYETEYIGVSVEARYAISDYSCESHRRSYLSELKEGETRNEIAATMF
ncbi:hypothetical protein FHS27_003318 [Rhodopirellula rubra]|uniref:Uncharacterized protein n=1 Tax=Aporhodopirellula rubra TaxID=980271 RepID=A0A7W5E0K6_9BACT|nr:hypothetical protein [Aporhodopirellula rubra]